MEERFNIGCYAMAFLVLAVCFVVIIVSALGMINLLKNALTIDYITTGDTILSFGNINGAIQEYKKAVFFDKYFIIWNDNSSIPVCYSKIANAYEKNDELTLSNDYYNKAIDAYAKYCPEDTEEIAYTHLRAMLVTNVLNDNSATIIHADKALQYYINQSTPTHNRNTATALIWLANAYYNENQYMKACDCFENGIPLYHDEILWETENEWDIKIYAVALKIASLSFKMIGNREKQQEYAEKYNSFIINENIMEEDLEEVIEYHHWMN